MSAALRLVARLATLSTLFVAAPAFAVGTVCGTVRDAITGAPVEGAGIFVLTTTGSFTGFEGASDATGAFCISGVPAGTYDLQVRRDDYRTTYVRNVVVNDDATGVDIGVPPVGGALMPPFPNPARDRVEFRLRVDSASALRLEVFDARGRRLKGWSGEVVAADERTVAWDFRGPEGRVMPAGIYIARLTLATASGISTVSRTFAHTR
jgi:hypothetical protein